MGNLTKNDFPWFTKVARDEEMSKQWLRRHDISDWSSEDKGTFLGIKHFYIEVKNHFG